MNAHRLEEFHQVLRNMNDRESSALLPEGIVDGYEKANACGIYHSGVGHIDHDVLRPFIYQAPQLQAQLR